MTTLAATSLIPFNTLVVLAGTMLLGIACGVVGVFTVLRGRALVADGVAHAALPGVCAAFMLFATRSLPLLLLGALAFAFLCLVVLALLRRHRLVREDAAIALSLSVFFGLGIVLLSIAQRSSQGAHAGLEGFIFGKAAGMLTSDVLLLAGVAGVTVVACALLHRHLRVLCFDRAFGAASGMPMGRVDAILMVLVCIATVAALPAVGLVLVVAMLTIPPATARLWTDRLGVMVVLSAVVAAASALVGTLVSASVARLSAGPVITLCAAACFAVSVLLAPRRGVFTQWVRSRLVQRRVALQNALRAIYEVHESTATTPPATISSAQLQVKRAWTPRQLEGVLEHARRAGWLTRTHEGVALTPAGALEAQRLVRAHRLWELYLIEQAAIASDHVDRDADAIEHILPEGVQRMLEQRLRAMGRLPGEPALPPPSPHAVPGASGAGVHG